MPVRFSQVSTASFADQALTELALRAGRGDKAALTDFIRATQDDVFELLSHLGNPDIAADLTQETYLKAIASLGRFKGRSSALTWLLAIARHTWIDYSRSQSARPPSDDGSGHAVTGAPDHSPGGFTDLVDARILLEGLDPERREALVLTQILGYSYAEAAKIIGVRVGTIRSRVARARADLIAAAGPATPADSLAEKLGN